MKPNFAIIETQQRNGYKVFTVDTAKATYQGMPWHSLGDFGKRKFENLLVLIESKGPAKVLYV